MLEMVDRNKGGVGEQEKIIREVLIRFCLFVPL